MGRRRSNPPNSIKTINMKRVVVLGSKPNAMIPDGDALYCANTSIGYYADQLHRFSSVVNIVSGGILDFKKRQEGYPDRDFHKKKWDVVSGANPDRLIVAKPKENQNVTDELRKAGFKAPIILMTAYERRVMIGQISGCHDPIVTRDVLSLPIQQQLACIKSIGSTLIKRMHNRNADCRAGFRPSTGVFALVHAIFENGMDTEYILSGIGLEKRGEYYGRNFAEVDVLESHVSADKKVLDELVKKYKIFTTEPELMNTIPALHPAE